MECICCANYYDQAKAEQNYAGDGQTEEDQVANRPDYVVGGGRPCGLQTALFRMWFIFFFVLVTAALVIGVVANGRVDVGLADTVDILFYNVQKMAYDVSKMLDRLNGIMADAQLGLDPAQIAEQQASLSCLSEKLKTFENDIGEQKDLGLDIRAYFVYVTLVVPFLIGLIYALSAWRKWSCCVGFGSLLAWTLLLFVCVSAAIHSLMALLFADICYEFDLHLASYTLADSDLYGTPENLAWLPEAAQGFCGEDGQLAFLEAEFEVQFDAAIQQGMVGIADACNDVNMQGFMDCSAVQILTGTGTPPSYVAKTVDYADVSCGNAGDEACGASYYNGLLQNVPDELKITDVDLAAVQVTTLADLPAEVQNCLASPHISKAGGQWPSTGWSDLELCIGSNGAPTGQAKPDCTGTSLWIGLDVDANRQSCTENGVAVTGSCVGLAGEPTGWTTQAECSTAGGTWTALDLTLASPLSAAAITSNAAACELAAALVYVGRQYGPTFAACTTPGDPNTCDRSPAAGSYTSPFDPAEMAALTAWQTTPPDAASVKDCFIEINTDNPCVTGPCVLPYFPRKTFRQCAAGCAEVEARANAETAVDAIDSATALFGQIHAIFDQDARPKLQCKFVSDILSDIFVPLCQESAGGIFLIAAANYIAAVGLIISLPLGIMATKRFKDYGDNIVGTKHQM